MEYDDVSEMVNKELTYYFGMTYNDFLKLDPEKQEELWGYIEKWKKVTNHERKKANRKINRITNPVRRFVRLLKRKF